MLLGSGPVVKGQVGRQRRCTIALASLWNSGAVMGLQRCWKWNRDWDLFPSPPPSSHCIQAAMGKETQYWMRPGDSFPKSMAAEKPASRLCHDIAQPGVRRGHTASTCQQTVVRSDTFTSKLNSLRAGMWSLSHLFWPTYSRECGYNIAGSPWPWVPKGQCRTDPLSQPAMKVWHELEKTKWFQATWISALVFYHSIIRANLTKTMVRLQADSKLHWIGII